MKTLKSILILIISIPFLFNSCKKDEKQEPTKPDMSTNSTTDNWMAESMFEKWW